MAGFLQIYSVCRGLKGIGRLPPSIRKGMPGTVLQGVTGTCCKAFPGACCGRGLLASTRSLPHDKRIVRRRRCYPPNDQQSRSAAGGRPRGGGTAVLPWSVSPVRILGTRQEVKNGTVVMDREGSEASPEVSRQLKGSDVSDDPRCHTSSGRSGGGLARIFSSAGDSAGVPPEAFAFSMAERASTTAC